jgi:hypothetical protein
MVIRRQTRRNGSIKTEQINGDVDMPKFRKKPIVIEAVQFIFEPERCKELADFLPDGIAPAPYHNKPDSPYYIDIPTLEGVMTADEGDWIIKGVKGEFYPCKPDVFEQTYELLVYSSKDREGHDPFNP